MWIQVAALCRTGSLLRRRIIIRISPTRNHMNHGGGGVGVHVMRNVVVDHGHNMASSPRSPLRLGLEASEASQQVLRLVESMYLGFQDSMEGVWHPAGVQWVWRHGNWSPREDSATTTIVTTSIPKSTRTLQEPRVLSLQFSDPRTALVHVTGIHGEHTLLSLLRLDSPIGQADNAALYNGWRIIRSVVQSKPTSIAPQSSSSSSRPTVYGEIESFVQTYFQIEHGGGHADEATAQTLFASHPSTSLLTIGSTSSPVDQPTTDWTAPLSSLLEIPLNIYLDGVHNQTPHGPASRIKDEMIAIRVLPCQSAAAVELRVGNGACDKVFHDHLLLGKHSDGSWKILSKIFSVQTWD